MNKSHLYEEKYIRWPYVRRKMLAEFWDIGTQRARSHKAKLKFNLVVKLFMSKAILHMIIITSLVQASMPSWTF